MLTPRVMKGLEKSMAFSRTWVMVRGATARSAFCNERQTDYEKSLRLAGDRAPLLEGRRDEGVKWSLLPEPWITSSLLSFNIY